MAKASAKSVAPSANGKAAAPVRAPTAVSALPPPIELGSVIGHAGAVGTLRGAASGTRLHHAWVFHGPPGIGKLTTARAFAAALLGVAAERAMSHPDLHIVTRQTARFHSDSRLREQKQTTIPTAVLRQFVIDPATLARTVVSDSPAAKVFIIDEADIMNAAGQNALLKTLEEPPPGTVLILVADNEDELLPTVRSRCQRVAFQALDDADMARWLAASGRDVAPADRADLFAFAAGSPGAALLALDHDLLTWGRTLRPMLAALTSGGRADGMGGAMGKLVGEQVERHVAASPATSKEHINRVWAGHMIAYLARWARAMLRSAAAGADPRPMQRALRAIDVVSEAQAQIDFNVRFGDVLDNLAMQLGVGGTPQTR